MENHEAKKAGTVVSIVALLLVAAITAGFFGSGSDSPNLVGAASNMITGMASASDPGIDVPVTLENKYKHIFFNILIFDIDAVSIEDDELAGLFTVSVTNTDTDQYLTDFCTADGIEKDPKATKQVYVKYVIVCDKNKILEYTEDSTLLNIDMVFEGDGIERVERKIEGFNPRQKNDFATFERMNIKLTPITIELSGSSYTQSADEKENGLFEPESASDRLYITISNLNYRPYSEYKISVLTYGGYVWFEEWASDDDNEKTIEWDGKRSNGNAVQERKYYVNLYGKKTGETDFKSIKASEDFMISRDKEFENAARASEDAFSEERYSDAVNAFDESRLFDTTGTKIREKDEYWKSLVKVAQARFYRGLRAEEEFLKSETGDKSEIDSDFNEALRAYEKLVKEKKDSDDTITPSKFKVNMEALKAYHQNPGRPVRSKVHSKTVVEWHPDYEWLTKEYEGNAISIMLSRVIMYKTKYATDDANAALRLGASESFHNSLAYNSYEADRIIEGTDDASLIEEDVKALSQMGDDYERFGLKVDANKALQQRKAVRQELLSEYETKEKDQKAMIKEKKGDKKKLEKDIKKIESLEKKKEKIEGKIQAEWAKDEPDEEKITSWESQIEDIDSEIESIGYDFELRANVAYLNDELMILSDVSSPELKNDIKELEGEIKDSKSRIKSLKDYSEDNVEIRADGALYEVGGKKPLMTESEVSERDRKLFDAYAKSGQCDKAAEIMQETYKNLELIAECFKNIGEYEEATWSYQKALATGERLASFDTERIKYKLFKTWYQYALADQSKITVATGHIEGYLKEYESSEAPYVQGHVRELKSDLIRLYNLAGDEDAAFVHTTEIGDDYQALEVAGDAFEVTIIVHPEWMHSYSGSELEYDKLNPRFVYLDERGNELAVKESLKFLEKTWTSNNKTAYYIAVIQRPEQYKAAVIKTDQQGVFEEWKSKVIDLTAFDSGNELVKKALLVWHSSSSFELKNEGIEADGENIAFSAEIETSWAADVGGIYFSRTVFGDNIKLDKFSIDCSKRMEVKKSHTDKVAIPIKVVDKYNSIDILYTYCGSDKSNVVEWIREDYAGMLPVARSDLTLHISIPDIRIKDVADIESLNPQVTLTIKHPFTGEKREEIVTEYLSIGDIARTGDRSVTKASINAESIGLKPDDYRRSGDEEFEITVKLEISTYLTTDVDFSDTLKITGDNTKFTWTISEPIILENRDQQLGTRSAQWLATEKGLNQFLADDRSISDLDLKKWSAIDLAKLTLSIQRVIGEVDSIQQIKLAKLQLEIERAK